MDTDLRELERRVAEAPEDAGARLALASGLAHEGRTGDACREAWIAAALGEAGGRELLARAGAPPSPWSHRFADAANTRRAPVRGPRRGEVVASAPIVPGPPHVISASGLLVGPGQGATVALRDPRTLAVVGERALAPEAPDGAGRRVRIAALADGGLAVSTSAHLFAVPPSGEGRIVATRPERDGFLAPRVDEQGRVWVATRDGELWLLSPSLEPVRRLPWTSGRVDVSGLAVGGGRVAVLADPEEEHQTGARLRLLDGEGEGVADVTLTFYEPPGGPALERTPPLGKAWGEPTISSDGSIFAVTMTELYETRHRFTELYEVNDFALHSLDREGRPRWESWLARERSLDCQVALAPDGGALALVERRLGRIAASGKDEWNVEATGGELVLDREGMCYFPAGDSLEARALDGTRVFKVPGRLTPLLIDAWGRLLCVRGPELVALA